MSYDDDPRLLFADDEKDKADSGIDCEDSPPLALPDTDVINRIVEQVETYFSDDNLIRDEFMVKNLRRNKEGFINLKLVTSFRRVKTITKDWRVVAHAIQIGSDKLELNENGTKVRRKKPLQPVDGSSKHSRTVIVINLPEVKEDIDEIGRDFSMFGKIGLIRIVKPNVTHPSHVKLLNQIQKHIEEIPADRSIAAIEFNFKPSAELCLDQQCRLVECDPLWASVKLYMLKKDECKVDLNNNLTCGKHSLKIGTHVIDKPTDDEVIIITVSSSSVTLTSKTKKPKCFTLKANTKCSNNDNLHRLRDPIGPNGTQGFAHHRPNL